MARITVTQLKCAVLDPEWRRSFLEGKKPDTRSYAQNYGLKVFGTRFHEETDRLAKWLTSREHLEEAAAIPSAEALLDVLWRISLQTFTDELLAKGNGDEAIAFIERIRSYCQRLIQLKARIVGFENWQDLFVFSEAKIDGIRLLVGGAEVEVAGRVDAIRFRGQQELEVVDYKLSQGSQQKSDFVQLAIYAHLLSLWRPGCRFCGILEYYLPEFMEVSISQQEMADIYTDLVEPVLVELFAPQSERILIISDPKPTAAPVGGADYVDLAAKVAAAYAQFNLGVETTGVVNGPQVVRIKLTPAPGVKVTSLSNRAEDLQVALALDEPPLIKPGKGFVIIDLPRRDRETIPLLSFYRSWDVGEKKSAMAFPIGVGIEGDSILADLSDSNTCHVLVAGTSGSGKSEWLKSAIASLTLMHAPEYVRVALVDPKILTFGGIKESPYLWRPVATNTGSALAILSDAVTEMEGRYVTLSQEGFINLADRFQAGRSDLPYIVLVFDEFADLILAGGSEKKAFEAMAARIAGKGRAAGIHLVLATQRPDRTVVTGLIKSNLPMKVCLRVTNATNSQIVLDEAGAESLLGRGDLLCDMGKGIIRAQSYFIPQADFLKALRV